MNKKVYLILLSVFAILISGCRVNDYSNYLAGYESDFIKETPYKVHSIDRDGYSIHAREFGKEYSEKAPIIAAHGFPDNLHLYDGIAPYISKKRRMISFDFIGWGYSEKPSPGDNKYNTKSLYKDLDKVISHFTNDKVVLIAHDISAFPIIDWALDNPDRIERLVILNSVYFRSKLLKAPEAIGRFSENTILRDIRVFGANISDAGWQTGVMKQISKFFFNEEAREKYIPLFAQLCFDIRPAFFGLNRVLRSEVSKRNSRIPEMKRFTQDVLILFGDKDPYLNSEVGKEFASIFPNSKLELLADGGHYVQLDSPEAVSKLILKGLK